jgi:hypothetical protein
MSGGEGFGSRILFQLQHRPAHMDDIPFKWANLSEGGQWVRQLYKNFGSRTLADAHRWFSVWANSKDNTEYFGITDVKDLQLALYQKFGAHHFPIVFSRATRAISFEECSSNGREFLRCMISLYLFSPAFLIVLRRIRPTG